MAGSELERLFTKTYEELSGRVRLAQRPLAAVQAVAAIVGEAQAGRVALGRLPGELRDSLTSRLRQTGVDVAGPPYRSSELPHQIDSAQVGVSLADFAIAETGTLVEFATDDALRLVSTLPRIHIGIVRVSSLVRKLEEAAAPIRKFFADNPRNAAVTFISGPSRTADIEMRLTLGVHGPEKAFAVLLRED